MIITSSHPNPIHPYGSTVTLICTVELSPLVDVAVNISTVWNGPAGFVATSSAHPVMGSTTTYVSTVMISSFGREHSGVYNCTATVNSASPYLINSTDQAFIRVSVGEVACMLLKLMQI